MWLGEQIDEYNGIVTGISFANHGGILAQNAAGFSTVGARQ